MNEQKNLKFRRQYILANSALTPDQNWAFFQINVSGKKWFINYHTDLDFAIEENENHSIILLGYILDPQNPSFNNQQIVSGLLGKNSFNEVLEDTANYNGRYVIIYYNKEEIFLFHDATGFREVYYTYKDNLTACGSTPDIIANNFTIPKTQDPDILLFFNSKEFKVHDHTWIGYKTLYENIMHLPPSHYIDLQNREIIRYWPSRKLNKIDIDSCARACAEILKGTIASANNRFELHMGITAGWDTRLLLAASRDFTNGIFYYVNKTSALSYFNKDIKIPKRLAKKFGFKLNVIDIPNEVASDFKGRFYNNNILAHDKLLPVFYMVYDKKWDHTVTVSGAMGNGLARIYMPWPEKINISGKNISQMAGYDGFKYVIGELEQWCKEVLPFCQRCGMNIMDMYQLEQENPNWASLTASEQDIVRDEIRPFNNRKLIELFWSLDDTYRYQYFPLIYIKIIEILWHDLLKIPINPSNRTAFYKILRILGIEQRTYNLYKKIATFQ